MNPHWRDDATCAQHDAAIWFPEDQETRKTARRLCRECPVLEECLDDALKSPTGIGIRAGLTPSQIRRVKELRAA